MKVGILIALFLPFFIVCTAQKWTLVWQDEFDYRDLPQSSNWEYEEGFVRNHEAQYYTPARWQNARVENGMLIIEARKEQFTNAAFDESPNDWRRSHQFGQYTSASITTRGKVAWKYGKIEVRAKLPTGKGTWPAIWMLGENIRQVGWPKCGEIDIMENVGFDPHTIHANIHTQAYNHVAGTNKGAKITADKPFESFHVYSIEWSKEQIDFFVDGEKYFTFQNEGTGVDVWPFDQRCYLILNLAIGGSWGGQHGIDDTIFPQRFYIDYVRVYQKR